MTDIKSYVARIERLMDEKKGLTEDISDIYLEAKGKGYVPKVLRKVITRLRQDPAKRAEEDSLQELYEGEISAPLRKAVELAASGASARKIEQETGIDQATVARSVSLKNKRETIKEAALSETAGVVPQPGDGAQDGGHTLAAQPAAVANSPEPPMTVPELAAATIALARTAPKQAAAVVAVLGALTEPDLAIPPFLRREMGSLRTQSTQAPTGESE